MVTRMFTLGGSVAFTDYSPDAVREVVEALEVSGYYEDYDVYRHADTAGAGSWFELFSRFKQVLLGADRGIYMLLGQDDLFYDLEHLFAVAAPFMQDGSWVAYHTPGEKDDVRVLVTKGGQVEASSIAYDESLSVFDYEASRSYAHTELLNAGFDLLPLIGELPSWAVSDSFTTWSEGMKQYRS